MSLDLTAASKNLALNALYDQANSGTIKIYTGSSPGSGNAATGTLLATLTFGSTAFAAASGASKAANAITSGTGLAAGTAGYARMLKSDGTTVIEDGTVGTSGTDYVLNTTSIVVGATVSCSALTRTM
jgi:hypothetical protein